MKKNKLFFKSIFWVFLLLATMQVYSQSAIPQNQLISIPPTPQASSLLKFLETPVREYTGVANISVPITEIRIGTLSLPVGLRYHSTGFKVEEQAGNIGLGWALEAGGSINSTVMGLPDFSLGAPYPVFPQDRELNPQKVLVGPGNYQENEDYAILMDLMGSPRVIDGAAGHSQPKDTKPDIFYYSYFGNSGKFFFTNNNMAHTIPFGKVFIAKVPGGFMLRDEHGNKFTYDEAEVITTASTTFTNDPEFGDQGGSVVNYAYYLSRITTPTRDTLLIAYDSQSYNYKNNPSYTRYRTLPGQPGCVQREVETRLETTTQVQGKFIKEITSSMGHRIRFLYDACQRLDMQGSYPLRAIEVYEGDNLKTYQLHQEYFGLSSFDCSSNVDQEAVKLKLKRIEQVGVGNYSLDYYNEYDLMPPRSSTAVDHWGYYNGSGGIFPPDPSFGYVHGANKSPDPDAAKYSMLQRIAYPTGGYSLFEYEGNTYMDTLRLGGTSIIPNGFSVNYEPSDDPSGVSYREIPFTIPSNANPSSIWVRYAATDGIANPQFSINLQGGGYSRSFAGAPTQQEYINLSPSDYVLTIYQTGVYENGYFMMVWTETVESEPEGQVNEMHGGGLRIKSIKKFKSSINSGPALTHRYTYREGGQGANSGRIFNKPAYSYLYQKTNYVVSDLGNNALIEEACAYYAQSANSNLPLNGLQYGNVIYTQVQKYIEDAEGIDNGYTNNRYAFVPDLKPYRGYPFTPATSYEWMNGFLLTSEVYGKRNADYVLKSRTTNVYEHNFTEPDFQQNYSESGAHLTPPVKPNEAHSVSLHVQVVRPEYRLTSQANASIIYPARFQIEYSKLISTWVYLKSSTLEEFYEQAPAIATATKYFYHNPTHAQPSVIETTASDGKIVYQANTYPHDYSLGYISLDTLKTMGVVTLPVESVTYQYHNDQYTVLSGHLTEYKADGTGLIDRQFSLDNSDPVPLAVFKFSNSSVGSLPDHGQAVAYGKDPRYKSKVQVLNYTGTGKPMEIKLEDGVSTSYLWGYAKRYPIAEIVNCSYAMAEQVLGAAAVESFARLANPTDAEVESFLAPLRNHAAMQNAKVTTFTYKALVGVSSVTDQNGRRTSYEYDSLNRLKTVRDHEENIIKLMDYHYQGQ